MASHPASYFPWWLARSLALHCSGAWMAMWAKYIRNGFDGFDAFDCRSIEMARSVRSSVT